jgi:hypothetical protein
MLSETWTRRKSDTEKRRLRVCEQKQKMEGSKENGSNREK